MKAVRGIFENGSIRPLEEIKIREKTEVYILFPEETELKFAPVFNPIKDLDELIGLVSLGGDALKDSERIYD